MQLEAKRSVRLSDLARHTTSKQPLGTVEYIERNYEPSDRLAIVVRNRLTGATTQRLATAQRIASPEFQAWLRHKNARGADIYISQNVLRSGARTRSKADVEKIRHVYLDLDINAEKALDKIDDSTLVPAPNFLIRTSAGRYQVIWKVANMAPIEAEILQKAMVSEFGGDPAATDSSRVLRLPGFQNKKYQRGYTVEVFAGSSETYSLPDFRMPADDRQSEAQMHEEARSHARKAGEISQSERDWAYVKLRLDQGEAPEKLVETLAHFRQDKPSPDYYARQTVSRAYSSFALARGDDQREIAYTVAQIATHQPHPTAYAIRTVEEMKRGLRESERDHVQPGTHFRVR